VVRVRDGEIVESRDYHDHLASARFAGGFDKLIEAVKAQDPAPAPGALPNHGSYGASGWLRRRWLPLGSRTAASRTP
jgi:hypothetical protein